MSIFLVLMAGIFGSIVNFCFRKNFERQTSADGYLSLYFMFSFAISFLIYSSISLESFSVTMSSIGIFAGSLNFLMMLLVAVALRVGPSGLTFAFQNSASIFPTLLLFLLFGTPYGFTMTLTMIFGFLCLIFGLFLSTRHLNSQGISKKWLFLSVAIFLIQGTILSLFQWRCLLLDFPANSHVLIPWSCTPSQDSWFMPAFFLIPALIQTGRFWISEKRWFSSRELILGTIAGLLNGGATFFLLTATKYAGEGSKAILFPLFAVTVILLCNLWSKYIYKEPIEWKGMTLCLIGVFIASL